MTRADVRHTLSLAIAVLSAGNLWGQDVVRIHRNDGVTLLTDITTTDSISFNEEGSTAFFHLGSTQGEVPVSEIDSIDFGASVANVLVEYSSDGVKVTNPYAFRGVEVEIESGCKVIINSSLTEEVTYELSGQGSGSFKLYSAYKQCLQLDGLTLTSVDGPAINIQSKKKTTVSLSEGTNNSLADVAEYTLSDTEDMKAALFSEGQIIFEGSGTLNVTGNYKHAICSDDYVRIKDGNVTVTSAASDGIHANDYFEMDGGTLTIADVSGDCIDASEGYVDISGGTLHLTAATADTKAIKCDSTLTISGGTLDINLTADQTKGLKSGNVMTLSGGELTFTCSGGVVIEDGETSYCAAIKADSLLTLSGADITITHTGIAGKGISCDANLTMTGGIVKATLSGNGGTYTNSSNESDTYNSCAIKVDGNLFIQDGQLTLSNSGSGGKCISIDGSSTFGDASHSPSVNVTTTGAAISSSSGGWGGWGSQAKAPGGGGGPGGGGPGGGNNPGGNQDASGGGNPKAIRGEGDITINNGSFTISTSNDGGEGIESKSTLTVNGGTIEANTYDDALQASQHIGINGGKIYAYASNNDGIDSNGTLSISGGLIIASGTTAPEEGFDCDQNTFSITGGTIFGIGGSTSTPTSSSCTQCSAVWSNASASSGTVYTVVDSSGNQVMSFTIPRNYGSATILFSSPDLSQGSSYKIYSGGTLTGGTTFHGLTTGATYSAGTQSKSFTINAKVTTLR